MRQQLGNAKPTTPLKHYAKWMPKGKQRFVSQLDGVLPEFGTKSWHQVDIMEEENSEVIEKDGGPYRDRTCGPLIKS